MCRHLCPCAGMYMCLHVVRGLPCLNGGLFVCDTMSCHHMRCLYFQGPTYADKMSEAYRYE